MRTAIYVNFVPNWKYSFVDKVEIVFDSDYVSEAEMVD